MGDGWDGPAVRGTPDTGTSSRTATPPPGGFGLPADAVPLAGGAPAIRDRVVAFVRRQRGEVFGNGECFTLADRALRHAGARSAADYGPVTPDGDYVWGAPIARADLQPGDIIQLRDYQCDLESTTENADGTDIVTQEERRPHHTAIVESVGANNIATVLEQNYPEGSPVTRNRLHLNSVTYTSGRTTTVARVSGTFWFYRPEAR